MMAETSASSDGKCTNIQFFIFCKNIIPTFLFCVLVLETGRDVPAALSYVRGE